VVDSGSASETGADTGADTGDDTAAEVPDVALSISSMGFMVDRMAGSFPISSGFDKSEESISPPPELLGGGGVGGGVIFCRIDASISSCVDSLATLSF